LNWIDDLGLINIAESIEIIFHIRFGRPILKGKRIAVTDVLNWMANGMSKQDIQNDFPELSEAMINACLLYAASRENHLGFAS